ncbi:hypothetical protein [Lachnospira pectinoschiza]|uniref:hypothetical protein n=1 Tax=Lachnospira pectinoschiza TaxID=28052 RepID=UPI0015D668A3|nr:hypothetical protein [Lachnospira pectinoschiza]
MVRTELDGITALKHLENIENGLLTIGTIPSIPQYNITLPLSDFQKLYQKTTIKFLEDDPMNLFHYLENEKAPLTTLRVGHPVTLVSASYSSAKEKTSGRLLFTSHLSMIIIVPLNL